MSQTNLDRLALVAHALGDLLPHVVFVGGCTTELLLDPAYRAGVRATEDVCLIVEIATRSDFYKLENLLRSRGFRNDPEINFRWQLIDDGMPLTVDVMPTMEAILGYSNPFYPEAFLTAEVTVVRGLSIRHLNHACFLGTKFVAFGNRGGGDYLGSQDMEDVVAVLDGCRNLANALMDQALPELKIYLLKQLSHLPDSPEFGMVLAGNCRRDSGKAARTNIQLCIKVLARTAS